MKQKNRFFLLVGLILALSGGIALVSYAQTAILFDKNIDLGGTKSVINAYGVAIGTTTVESGVLTVGSGGIKFSDTSSLTSASGIGGGGLASTTPFSAGYIPYATSSSAVTNSVIFQSGGNVGIGTTAPEYKLEVNGGTAANITGILTNVASYSGMQFMLNSNATGIPYFEIGKSATTDNAMAWGWDNANQVGGFWIHGGSLATGLTMKSGGNVGIGTTGPDAKLDVFTNTDIWGIEVGDRSGSNSNLRIAGTAGGATGYGLLQMYQGTAGGGNLVLQRDGGNVGIGDTGPMSKLQIRQDPTNTNQPSGIQNSADTHTAFIIAGADQTLNEKIGMQFAPYGVASQEFSVGGIFGLLDSVVGNTIGDITFDMRAGTGDTALTEVMRIQNDGNVGIGTTTPAYKLDVVGTGRFTQPVIVGTPTGGTHAATKSYVDSAVSWTTTSTGIFYNSGNVGIGTASPLHKLDISGTFYSRLVVKGNCTGAVTINWNDGNTQHCVFTGNVTFTFSNGQSGGNYRLILKQDATGSRTVTWPASVRWGSGGQPTLTTTASKTDYVGFFYNGVDSKYDGVAFNANF